MIQRLSRSWRQRKLSQRPTGVLILARVNTPNDIKTALAIASDALSRGIPIWFIYRKGAGHPLNEGLVRSTALAAGIVDTEVAAVSATLTALRFLKRKS